MGLDSVELLMRFEKEFKKDEPDEDAATDAQHFTGTLAADHD